MSEKVTLTDIEVEAEIERLKKSPHVILAKRAEAIRNKRKQYMWTLRSYEKKGKALAALGVTLESLVTLDKECGGEV